MGRSHSQLGRWDWPCFQPYLWLLALIPQFIPQQSLKQDQPFSTHRPQIQNYYSYLALTFLHHPPSHHPTLITLIHGAGGHGRRSSEQPTDSNIIHHCQQSQRRAGKGPRVVEGRIGSGKEEAFMEFSVQTSLQQQQLRLRLFVSRGEGEVREELEEGGRKGEEGRECAAKFFINQILQLQMADNQVAGLSSRIFSLIRLKAECRVAPVRVDFEALHRPDVAANSIVPCFNSDRAFFTPSFLLAVDKKYYQENTAFQKCQFEEKMRRSANDYASSAQSGALQTLNLPTPSSNYCQICQEKFTCYYRHLELKAHRIRTTNAEASQLIRDLCTDVSQSKQKPPPTPKSKPIAKEVRREVQQLERKANKSRRREVKEVEVELKGQNYSTCILEDSMRQLNQ